jgi:bacterioferritin-associated ferredoxin
MYVCCCRAVTDRTVDAAIAAGARSLEEIADRCGAGSCCGGCWPELQRLLAQQHARAARRDTRIAV